MSDTWTIFILGYAISISATLILLSWKGANIIGELKSEQKQLKLELNSLKEQAHIIQNMTEETIVKIESRMEKIESSLQLNTLSVKELSVMVKVLLENKKG